MTEEEFRKFTNQIVLAASRGVLAVVRQENLGEVARGYGYSARTHTGDAFETAFLWAQEELKS